MQHEHVAGIRLAFGRTCYGECSVGDPPTQWETFTIADVSPLGDAPRVSRCNILVGPL